MQDADWLSEQANGELLSKSTDSVDIPTYHLKADCVYVYYGKFPYGYMYDEPKSIPFLMTIVNKLPYQTFDEADFEWLSKAQYSDKFCSEMIHLLENPDATKTRGEKADRELFRMIDSVISFKDEARDNATKVVYSVCIQFCIAGSFARLS